MLDIKIKSSPRYQITRKLLIYKNIVRAVVAPPATNYTVSTSPPTAGKPAVRSSSSEMKNADAGKSSASTKPLNRYNLVESIRIEELEGSPDDA